jgi:ABC-type polysaccharide/polyol phosphate transport system ATPase subunit
MSKPAAIIIDRVCKQYRRVAHTHRFLTLKSALVGGNMFTALAADQVFTALEDVSMTVEQGETFGVIGGNGAGKSTLLKIIAGTTKPTTGEAEVNGKISALIELGAGFHPEISGRENVFINGIMLGLTRAEIKERFDDIVAFAELEEFIDAPVKTYSSGMYMRLGFSVAIHVDPDVLLIDEVLAVGDESYVHKCLDKIAEFKRRGKTILLVSHGLETVSMLCDRVMWLRDGQVQVIGDPPAVIGAYRNWVAHKEEEELAEGHQERVKAAMEEGPSDGAVPASVQPAPASPAAPAAAPADSPEGGKQAAEGPYEPGRWGSRQVVIEEIRLLDAEGEQRYVFACGEPMTIEMRLSAAKPVEDFVFGLGIFNPNGVCCYGTNTDIEKFKAGSLAGEATVRVVIPELNLIEGTYYLDAAVHRRDSFAYDYQRGLCRFRTTSTVGDVGVARLQHSWEFDGSVAWQRTGGIAPAGE